MKVVAASQGGSNLTLIVAILGIVGTLSAALITQWLTGRRESSRCEQERQERREQWAREDLARLHQKRLAAYETGLVAFDRAEGELCNILPDTRTNKLSIQKASSVEKAFSQVESAMSPLHEPLARIELIGSQAVVNATRACYDACGDLASAVFSKIGPPKGQLTAPDIQDLDAAYRRRADDLRASIRRDIGSDR